MQFQVNELVNLTIALAVLPPMVVLTRRLTDIHSRNWPLWGYVAAVVAYILTVTEGVGGVPGEWLNLCEHVAMLASGLLFLAAARDVRAATAAARKDSA